MADRASMLGREFVMEEVEGMGARMRDAQGRSRHVGHGVG